MASRKLSCNASSFFCIPNISLLEQLLEPICNALSCLYTECLMINSDGRMIVAKEEGTYVFTCWLSWIEIPHEEIDGQPSVLYGAHLLSLGNNVSIIVTGF